MHAGRRAGETRMTDIMSTFCSTTDQLGLQIAFFPKLGGARYLRLPND